MENYTQTYLAEQFEFGFWRVDIERGVDGLEHAGPGGLHLALHGERAHPAVAAAAAGHDT